MLSVIVPAYNAENFLGNQLEALRAQDYEGYWEIVAVDNGSTDGTVEVIRRFQCQMPHLRLVCAPEKQNRSYARNRGVKEARGEAFLFCDADDTVSPRWVSALADALDECDVVAGAIEVQTLNPEVHMQRAYLTNGSKNTVLDFLPFVSSSNVAISRKAFEAVQGFSEEYSRCVDVDISWRLQLEGYRIHDAPAAVSYYRLRRTLLALWRQNVGWGWAHVKLYRQYGAYGMPRSATSDVLRRYMKLFRKMPSLGRGRKKRMDWVEQAGVSWGRLIGSLYHRTMYF